MTHKGQVKRNTAQFTRSEIAPSTAVINETAEFLGRDPTELRPLGTRVDADSLDGLFAGHGTPSGRTGRSGSVAFEYHGLDVSVEFGPDRTFSVELTR